MRAPHTRLFMIAATTLVAVTLPPSPAAAAGGSFQRLDFYPAAVSDDGSVVVGSRYSGPGREQPVRWIRSGEVDVLGSLPGGATGVSADGSVIVGYVQSDSGTQAVLWTERRNQLLGDLPGGRFFSRANGVSADGSVVVGSSHAGGPDDQYEAFRWTAAGGMRSLGQPSTSANAVSADGSVIAGTRGSANGSYDAFRWTQSGGIQGAGVSSRPRLRQPGPGHRRRRLNGCRRQQQRPQRSVGRLPLD